ncbi:hypothetical protein ABW20_dc0101537 [Dactylellina cionopaga]|nr:hypothetical protein ABW20_dc0101537 [Dactylellina cionopaga]
MPSFASFSNSKPLTIGKGRDPKSYPPVSMKAPSLPETLHLDTSDLLVSVQSVPSPLGQADQDFHNYQDYNHDQNLTQTRPPWHRSDPYPHGEPSFRGGHQYKIERLEEKRRLRSLGLLSGSSTPQSEFANSQFTTATTTTATMSTPTSQKTDAKRRSSWQPPIKGKLKKRNKSKDPDQRKSLDTKHASIEYQPSPPPPPPQQPQQQPQPQQQQQQQHHYSFSRIQNYPPSPMGSPCATPSPMMTPTRELMHPNPPFAHSARSNSSLGTLNSATSSTFASPSLGDLVGFYGGNSPGQAFSTAPSSPIVALHPHISSPTASPVGFHRPRYTNQPDSPITSVAPSPLLTAQIINPPAPAVVAPVAAPATTTPVTTAAAAATTTNPPPVPAKPLPKQSPLVVPLPVSRGNSSTTSLNSSSSQKPSESQPEKSGFQPYQPKYAAKSHVTSTVPLAQSIKQEQPAGPMPFVHLDFAPPPKPFARPSLENRKSTSDTRLTTQEAKEYNAIAQATREAYYGRTQSSSEASVPPKVNARPQPTPSRLSFEVRNTSTPDSQPGKINIPPKSILRKPVELPVEEIPKSREEPPRRQNAPQPTQPAAKPLVPDMFRPASTPTRSEPVSPANASPEPEAQTERGRSMFKRGEEQSDHDLSRKSSVSARKSIDIETTSAKNFDISKYTQDKSSKSAQQGKQPRSYPPVSYKAFSTESSPNPAPAPESSGSMAQIPPVPPLPESMQQVRGLSTPPPIRSDNAIESSDEESMERPSTSSGPKKPGKSKLSSNVTTIESAPARPRAPSMSEILKDLYKSDAGEPTSPEPTDTADWLSQLFRAKKPEKPKSRPTSVISTPISGSPPLGKRAKSPKDSKRSSRHFDMAAEGQKVHERAERQRLEVERKLLEAESSSDLSLTPRSSPRFPRPTVSVTASPDLRVPGADASSLRSASTCSVDRLDAIVGGSLLSGKNDDVPGSPSTSSDEKKFQIRKRRPSSAEVRQQLGEMTPPHEREDWEIIRDSQSSFSNFNLPQTQITPPAAPESPSMSTMAPAPLVVNKPVPGRLPVAVLEQLAHVT